MDRRTSGVDFLADCDAYYHSPFDVRWDRNDDGSFETAGSAIEFDATAVDGPARSASRCRRRTQWAAFRSTPRRP